MAEWAYVLDGEVISSIRRDDIDPPDEGTRLTFIGRLGIPAPAEHFIFARVDGDTRTAYLERDANG
jgi:hypothetical protein